MLLLLGGDTEICPGPQKTLSDFFTSRGFKIVHQNVRGIPSNHHLLESFVNKTELKTDPICVSETHIKDGIFVCDNSSLYSLPDYVFLQRNRNGGGVGIFLKHKIKFKLRYDLENHLESLWIEICFKKSSKSVLIGCYYRPPEWSFDEQL